MFQQKLLDGKGTFNQLLQNNLINELYGAENSSGGHQYCNFPSFYAAQIHYRIHKAIYFKNIFEIKKSDVMRIPRTISVPPLNNVDLWTTKM